MRSAAATPTIIFVVVVFMSARKRELPPQKLSRSEEHTSELQSQSNLVCRLLLEKKNIIHRHQPAASTEQTTRLREEGLLRHRLPHTLPAPAHLAHLVPYPLQVHARSTDRLQHLH